MNTNLTSFIKSEAYKLGFSKVGIARSEILSEEGIRLKEWLNKDFHADMAWIERNVEKRINPAIVYPEVKSIVSVALNYYTDVKHEQNSENGKISRYAWGDDYHEVLTKSLTQLLQIIKVENPSVEGKLYVDTGPMMDKVWAQKAGIGWEGKHTNIITQEFGSWVFLGEILLNIELDYDAPAIDHCGDCVLCIEACPTDAIVEPYVIDSNKCISYLTIEHRGDIAPELSANFEQWIYGCDICQDVCPWNEKFSVVTDLQEFHPRDFNISPTLKELAEISQEEFSKKYKKSPIKRTKVSGMRRNASLTKIDD